MSEPKMGGSSSLETHIFDRLSSEGFFTVEIRRDFAQDQLHVNASFVCDKVGFVYITRAFSFYEPTGAVIDRVKETRNDYFKWKEIWEKVNGYDAGEKS